MTKIGMSAFEKCTQLKTIEIPDSVIEICQMAFRDCEELSEVKLSSNIKDLWEGAFYNDDKIVEIEIPKSLEKSSNVSTWGGPFAKCSGLKKVKFEEGTTKVVRNLLCNCDGLETINIPSTVTVIENSAFEGCTQLRTVEMSENVTEIGMSAFDGCKNVKSIILTDYAKFYSNTFSNCDELVVNINYISDNVTNCIDYGLNISPTKIEKGKNIRFINRKKSYYETNISRINGNGSLKFVSKFNIKDDYADDSDTELRQIDFYIPKEFELDESSIRFNGKSISDEDYYIDAYSNYNILVVKFRNDITYDGDCYKIPNEIEVSYQVKVNEKKKVLSYAKIEGYVNDSWSQETLGVIDEEYLGISIDSSDIVNDSIVDVSGIAGASDKVELFVDDVKQSEVEVKKNGSYEAQVKLNNPKDNWPYRITAKCVDEDGTEYSSSVVVIYREQVPTLKNLKMNYKNGSTGKITTVDLMNTNGIKPLVYFAPSTDFEFSAEFENGDSIDEVYITSTRNKETKTVNTDYNEEKGLYVSNGKFDNNSSYVPGTIGVEYYQQANEVEVDGNFDISSVTKLLKDEFDEVKIDYTKHEEGDIEASLDYSEVSGVLGDLAQGEIKATVKYYDAKTGGDYGNMLDISDTAMKYIIPGVDDKRYAMAFDYSDPDNIEMLLYDVTDTGLTIADSIISMKMDISQFNSDFSTVNKLSELDWKLTNFGMAASVIHKTYGIYSDYNDLLKEIENSDSIVDKYTARKKAAELKDDQMGFMLLMMCLPLLVAGPEMALASAMFSGLIAVMQSTSSIFWNARIANIKSGKYKANFVIDPSGYVFDKDTSERINGAKVTAYWIPYDDSDDFYSNKPNDNEYGTIWNGLDYEQNNPLITDEEGRYSWDVPEGWWRIKCEKEGYETSWTEWMTVPPIQTDVNIALSKISNGNVESEGKKDSSESELPKQDKGSNINKSTKANSIISDGKYYYKVTLEGSNGKAVIGEVEVIGLKKKSLDTIKIAKQVTIGNITYNITSISKNAFKNNKKSKKIIIGKNVKTIGISAFENCKKLKQVTIYSTVLISIGKKAFYGDNKLKKVLVKSKKIKKIGKKAFFRKKGKKIIFKVPKAKKKAYRNLLKTAKTNKYAIK